MRFLRALPVAFAAALAAAGCLPPDQSGADGGSSSDAATGTVGQQCTRMYTALCAHAINDCAFTNISLDQCVNAGMPACCADQCAAKAITPNATVNQCVLALEVEDCNYVAQNLTPPECAGIPAIP